MLRIFHHYINKTVILSMIVDFGFVLGAMIVFGAIFSENAAGVSALATHGLSLATWTLVVEGFTGIHQPLSTQGLKQIAMRALVAASCLVPLAFGLSSFLAEYVQSPELLSYATVGTVLVVLAYRSIAVYAGSPSIRRWRVLVLGTGQVAKQVGESLMMANAQMEVVGYFPSPNERECLVPQRQVFASSTSLAMTAARARVDEVVVALTERRGGSMSLRDLLDCKVSGICVSDVATHYEMRMGQIKLDHVNAGWLIFGGGFNQGIVRTALKRVFDLLCASLLLILTLPLMLVTMLLIAIDSPGPIFYRQERVGLNGTRFHVIKFRSMRRDAECDGKPRWAADSDDRVTRIGRLTRHLRIDELPQLVNVLKGEMSLVGPRPERPFFVDTLTHDIPYYAVRHSVKPGITGWAQVSYQYGATFEDTKQKLQYDLYYVKNNTLFLDLLIMVKTVAVVLTGKGAR